MGISIRLLDEPCVHGYAFEEFGPLIYQIQHRGKAGKEFERTIREGIYCAVGQHSMGRSGSIAAVWHH
jgi:hypothetical protein